MSTSLLEQKADILNVRTQGLDQMKTKTLLAKRQTCPMPLSLLSFPWGHPCLMPPSAESIFIYQCTSPKLGLSYLAADREQALK